MKISITSPISGKSFVIFEYLNGIKKIVQKNPDIEWVWCVCDTSESPSIKARVDDCAKELGIDLRYGTYPKGVAYEDYSAMMRMEELRKYMPGLMNALMALVPECDYVFNIEDDIVCINENPVPMLLNGFDDNVAAVVGTTFTRRLGHKFGAAQGLNLTGCTTEWVLFKTSGYETISRTAFGFILMKYEYAKMPFVAEFAEATAFDPAFGARMEALGKRLVICWDVLTKHYFKAKDGSVGFAGIDSVRRDLNLVRKQWHRKSSPLFIEVPENLELTQELVDRHLAGQPTY